MVCFTVNKDKLILVILNFRFDIRIYLLPVSPGIKFYFRKTFIIS